MPMTMIPTSIASRAEHFRGRSGVLNEIANWVRDGDERFFLLTGEPGCGKTSVAAWLAGAGPQPESKDGPTLPHTRNAIKAAHFCIAGDKRGSLDPARLCEVITRQLSETCKGFASGLLRKLAPQTQFNIHLVAAENHGTMVGAQVHNLVIRTSAEEVYNRTVREPLSEFELYALSVARAISLPDERASALTFLAAALASISAADTNAVIDETLETIRLLPSRAGRAREFRQLATSLADKANSRSTSVFSDALEAVRSDEKIDSRAIGLQELARAMAEAGDSRAELFFAEALSVANTLTDPGKLADTLSSMAGIGAINGRFSQALELARSVGDPPNYHPPDYPRKSAIATVVAAMTSNGLTREVEELVDTLGLEQPGLLSCRNAPAQLAANGFLADAVALLSRMPEGWNKTNTLSDIAEAIQTVSVPDIHSLGVLFEIARSDNSYTRSDAIKGVAISMARNGYFASAIAAVESLSDITQPDIISKTAALSALVSVSTDRKDLDRAGALARHSYALASNIEEAYVRKTAMDAAAKALCEAGCIEEAYVAIQQLDENSRPGVQAALALQLANHGRADEAANLIWGISDKSTKVHAILDYSKVLLAQRREASARDVLMSSGDHSVLELASSIEDDYSRARALRALLKAIVDSGFLGQSNDRIVILVDGLDEAASLSGTNIVDLIAGSNDFPPRVRFLLTSRNDSRVLARFSDSDARRMDLSAPQRVSDNRQDIIAYLRSRFKSIPTIEEIVDEIATTAEGNFLYAKLVSDNLLSEGLGSVARSVVSPKGLHELYYEYLERLIPKHRSDDGLDSWMASYQPVLGCISAAIPAAPESGLARWLEKSVSSIASTLNTIEQLTEYDDAYGGSYRLFHGSLGTFLQAPTIGRNLRNRFYTPAFDQHTAIIKHYFGTYSDRWSECDTYGLLQLVSHILSRLEINDSPIRRKRDRSELYDLVLSQEFRRAQLTVLANFLPTANDLKSTLRVALENNDLRETFSCIAIYHDILSAENISRSFFAATNNKEFDQALRIATVWGTVGHGRWARELHLYLALQAATVNDVRVAQDVMRRMAKVAGDDIYERLDETFLVCIAMSTAENDGQNDVASTLLTLAPEMDAQALLLRRSAPVTTDADTLQEAKHHLTMRLKELEINAAGMPFQFDPIQVYNLHNWQKEISEYGSLGDLLCALANDQAGRDAVDFIIKLLSGHPYTHYRDVILVDVCRALLDMPDTPWKHSRLEAALTVGLKDAGATFAFDLLFILLTEAKRRELKLPVAVLQYQIEALAAQDVWGTAVRAHSALAASHFWQGNISAGQESLACAYDLVRKSFAGYAILNLLSLSDRCIEFGVEYVSQTENVTANELIKLAYEQIRHVVDPSLSQKRAEQVRRYERWTAENQIDGTSHTKELSSISDLETRGICIAHISARHGCASSPSTLADLKALVSLALDDITTLDAVLGRLFGSRLRSLTDSEVLMTIDVYAEPFLRQ